MLTVRLIGLKETCQPDKPSTYTLYQNTRGVVSRKVFGKKKKKDKSTCENLEKLRVRIFYPPSPSIK